MMDQNIEAFGYRTVLGFYWYCHSKDIKNDVLLEQSLYVHLAPPPGPNGHTDFKQNFNNLNLNNF